MMFRHPRDPGCTLKRGHHASPVHTLGNNTHRTSVRVRYVRSEHRRPDYSPSSIDDPNYVRIFDTTLRDGEQSPGASLTSKQKLSIARQLSKLGVDVIEAGFPVASPDDFEGVRLIAREVGNEVQADGHVPVICAMARTLDKDLDRAWEAVRHAQRPRVHTLIATSDIHMEHKLHMTREQVLERAVAAVSHLRSLGCTDIEFTAEDASRSDPDFLCEVLGAVIAAGAATLMVPDTVGYSVPSEYGDLIRYVRAHTRGIEGVVVSAHCHDDLGCSTCNSLAAAMAGARQIECTINGIGERAGNASLEEIVMAIKLKGDDVLGGLWTGITPAHLYPTSRMVSEFSGMLVQPNKAIVGANAFAHESGMHQDGMLKHKGTYQIMSPETIGLVRKSADAGIVLGKHSGRHALAAHLGHLGYSLSKQEVDELFLRFKVLADAKKVISDDDLLGLVGDTMGKAESGPCWELVDLHVVRPNGMRECTVQLRGPDGTMRAGIGKGPGPVAAAYKAIDGVLGLDPVPTLLDYTVNSLTEGIEALVTTRVVIKPTTTTITTDAATPGSGGSRGDGLAAAAATDMGAAKPELTAEPSRRQFSGQGTDEDIVVSSAMAYVAALNKLIAWREQQEAQQELQEQQEPHPLLATLPPRPPTSPEPQQAPAAAPPALAQPRAGRGRRRSTTSRGSGQLVAV